MKSQSSSITKHKNNSSDILEGFRDKVFDILRPFILLSYFRPQKLSRAKRNKNILSAHSYTQRLRNVEDAEEYNASFSS